MVAPAIWEDNHGSVVIRASILLGLIPAKQRPPSTNCGSSAGNVTGVAETTCAAESGETTWNYLRGLDSLPAQRLQRVTWLLTLAPHLGQRRALSLRANFVRGRLFMVEQRAGW